MRALSLALVAGALFGCSGNTTASVDSTNQVGAADDKGNVSADLAGGVPIGSQLKTTASLNLRTGPGTGNSIRLVIPEGATVVTVNTASPTNGWYNIKYNGVVGWSSGAYLTLVSSIVTADRAGAILRAQSGVGFSYYWGHGSWNPNALTASNAGSCTGDCPNCTHSGRYGADCSGYVAKTWQVPSSNSTLTSDSHPYSTATFVTDSSQRSTIDRADLQLADAMVYNTNGAGHIFLYESGDGWGDMWVYEAKGCVYGIVHDLRSATTAFHAIARDGY